MKQSRKTRPLILVLTALVLALALCAGCGARKSASRSDSYAYATEAAAADEYISYDNGYAMYGAADSAYPMEAPAAGVNAKSASTVTQAAKEGESGAEVQQNTGVRKVIYNGDMQLTADNPSLAAEALENKLLSLGGYVSERYASGGDNGITSVTMTLKIPAESLDEIVAVAESAGKVTSYSLSSDDITMSYYDITARLNSAKAEEQQLLEILGKCDTVEDILLVRESLSSVRADIESYQGRINLWDNLVAYTTLSIRIRKTPTAQVSAEDDTLSLISLKELFKNIKNGFKNSGAFVVNALASLVAFLAALLIPCAVLFLIIGLPIILVRKNKKKKKTAKAAAAAAKAAEAAAKTSEAAAPSEK